MYIAISIVINSVMAARICVLIVDSFFEGTAVEVGGMVEFVIVVVLVVTVLTGLILLGIIMSSSVAIGISTSITPCPLMVLIMASFNIILKLTS